MLTEKRAWVESLVLGLILLLALTLRCYRLNGQSLWADEGNSAALALRTLPTITRDAARDIHPPLYYYLLHFWVLLWGNGEIALRSLSALSGTMLVLVTYGLGRGLFNRRVGLIAAFLASISPFQIYYSQETRMYVLAALWAALSVLFFVAWMRSWTSLLDTSRWHAILSAALYVVFTAAALYTHYFAFTIPVLGNLAYALGMIVYPPLRRPGRIAGWVLAQVAIIALYLPWLHLAGGQLTTWPAISEPLSLWSLASELLRVFSLDYAAPPGTKLPLGFGLLLLLGTLPWALWPRLQDSRRWPALLPRAQLYPLLFTLLYLCVPVLAMYVLSLSRPAYDPKFLLLATPAFSLLLARGVGGEWLGTLASHRVLTVSRWTLTGLLLLLVVAAELPSLANYYFNQHYARDDYRGVARYISSVAEEGDAIILNAPGQKDIFSYYYHGQLSVYPLPGQRPLDEGKTGKTLEDILAQHGHLYVLFWGTDESDPGRFIEGWLDQRAFKAMDSWFGNLRLAVYAAPDEAISAEIQHPLELVLGDSISLLGYSISSSEVEAGDILQLALFWQASQPVEQRFKVFTHLLDAQSHIVGQRDSEPVGGTRPTTTWQDGEIIVDNYGLLVLPGTPPGENQLEIGMYSLETGERLPVSQDGAPLGDRVLLEQIQVLQPNAPPPTETLGIQYMSQVDFGPVRLVGYDMSKPGYEHLPHEPVSPGETLHLTPFWQAVAQMRTGFTLTLKLGDQADIVVISKEVRPTRGALPRTHWQPGQMVRDQHNLVLPAELSSGKYGLWLEVRGLSLERGPLRLASLTS
jgi:mannosyltransferase